jgi:hypothetical protein
MADLFSRAKALFPDLQDDDIQDGIVKVKTQMPTASDDEVIDYAQKNLAQPTLPAGNPSLSSVVKDTLLSKYGLDSKYSDEARQKIVDSNAADAEGLNWTAGLAGLGAALQGRDSVQAGMAVRQFDDKKRQSKLDEFDKGRQGTIQKFQFDRDITTAQKDDEKRAREADHTSSESAIARELAKEMGYKGDLTKLTAAQFQEFSPALQKKYEIQQRKLERQEARDDRNYQRQVAKTEKMDKYLEERSTPYGVARTADDAKKLKEAGELKSKFDRMLDEMIDLRKTKGAETFDRESVGRGKQLSKDLLLAYKDLAKLGVLSQSDEAILNEIIPSDPLQWNAASLVGQDPTMVKLTKFKEDSNTDFQTRLETRLKTPSTDLINTKAATPSFFPLQVRKDGQVTTVENEDELKEARAEGWK